MALLAFAELPLEVLRNILVFLDVHALLQISRTSHLFRTLSLDPLLQKARLLRVRHDLNILLLHRPPRASISPPNAWIWLSNTNVLSRSISKSLIKIRLNHSLERRPCIEELVERAILPECYSCTGTESSLPVVRREEVRKSHLKDKLERLLEHRPSIDKIVELNIMPAECASGSAISPKIVETRRRVIKEHLKDGLRAWVKVRAIEEQRRKEEEYDSCVHPASVKAIVRRFSARKEAAQSAPAADGVMWEKKYAQARWGREAEIEKRKEERRAAVFGTCSQPTRAHVLGLRRFWEGIIKADGG